MKNKWSAKNSLKFRQVSNDTEVPGIRYRNCFSITSHSSSTFCQPVNFLQQMSSPRNINKRFLTRHSSLHHTKPRKTMADQRFRLNRQHSKLDLIDSSTLTSLPFPPPLKSSDLKHKRSRFEFNRSKSASNIFDDRSRTKHCGQAMQTTVIPTTHASHQMDHQVLKDLPMEEVSFTSIDTLTTPNMTSEIDDSFNDDTEEPIIFVEDYMEPQKQQNPAKSLFRQQSLANFKERMHGDLKKRKISDHTSQKENLEEIFGNIPGKNLLKHCEICDKPLYEISSIINNKRKKYDAVTAVNTTTNTNTQTNTSMNTTTGTGVSNTNFRFGLNPRTPNSHNTSGPGFPSFTSTPTQSIKSSNSGFFRSSNEPSNDNNSTSKSPSPDTTRLNNVFNEFICVECIEVYEEFLSELYTGELESERTNSFNLPESKNLKLLNIFKTIQLRSNNRQFHSTISNNLISRLKFLNSNSLSNEFAELNDINWLKTLQNKLRWRWRLNGLIPSIRKKE